MMWRRQFRVDISATVIFFFRAVIISLWVKTVVYNNRQVFLEFRLYKREVIFYQHKINQKIINICFVFFSVFWSVCPQADLLYDVEFFVYFQDENWIRTCEEQKNVSFGSSYTHCVFKQDLHLLCLFACFAKKTLAEK